MNRYLTILLLFALLGSSFSRFAVYAAFDANQKYIAEQLCENKSRPEMHCNGKCYLMKKLKAAEEREKKEDKANLKHSFQEGIPHRMTGLVFISATLLKLDYPQLPVKHTVNTAITIFQPPKFG